MRPNRKEARNEAFEYGNRGAAGNAGDALPLGKRHA